jgi:hypothetical protein
MIGLVAGISNSLGIVLFVLADDQMELLTANAR